MMCSLHDTAAVRVCLFLCCVLSFKFVMFREVFHMCSSGCAGA